MYSSKKNVLQTVALLQAYNIRHIVLSPGSRNAPLIQTFSQNKHFLCQVIVDERNAAFHALGIIQATHQPVAICCTSGTALLNYAPAVAEAFYQRLPLIVISADRSDEWIGQMDGQTIHQNGALSHFVKKSVHLPETNEWHINRLLNEALINCISGNKGPVHINIPISEPLFDYSETILPEVRKINYPDLCNNVDITDYIEIWNKSKNRIIVVGQCFKNEKLIDLLVRIVNKCNCVVLTEHLSNCNSEEFISNFDKILSQKNIFEKPELAADLVISLGGHIVSKHLKQFIRSNKPKHHLHLSRSADVVDIFQSLTDLIDCDPELFLSVLEHNVSPEDDRSFQSSWKKESKKINEPCLDNFSETSVIGNFIKSLPYYSALHLANSSSVRHAQLFSMDKSIHVFCNRGTNGIESSLPSTIGFASVYDGLVYLIIGDLSFFYTINALWNISHIKNLRILLINNGGGGIFRTIPLLKESESLNEYVSVKHRSDAKEWALAANFKYLTISKDTNRAVLPSIMNDSSCKQSIIIECFINE